MCYIISLDVLVFMLIFPQNLNILLMIWCGNYLQSLYVIKSYSENKPNKIVQNSANFEIVWILKF